MDSRIYCDAGVIAETCTIETASDGLLRWYNASCTQCCFTTETLAIDFDPVVYCVPETDSVIWMGLTITIMALIALFSVVYVAYIWGWLCMCCGKQVEPSGSGKEKAPKSMPASFAIIGFLSFLIAVVGSIEVWLVMVYGRHAERSSNFFWVLFLAFTATNFMTHYDMLYVTHNVDQNNRYQQVSSGLRMKVVKNVEKQANSTCVMPAGLFWLIMLAVFSTMAANQFLFVFTSLQCCIYEPSWTFCDSEENKKTDMTCTANGATMLALIEMVVIVGGLTLSSIAYADQALLIPAYSFEIYFYIVVAWMVGFGLLRATYLFNSLKL
jgi:hypothetical protein